MADGRVLRIVGDLREGLEEEMSWLTELPMHIFEKLAAVCSLSPVGLRSKCLRAGHINIAFMEERFLCKVAEYPHCLAIGDSDEELGANLDRLAASSIQVCSGMSRVILQWYPM